MCVKPCCRLNPVQRQGLDKVVTEHAIGRAASATLIGWRTLKALLRRHYVEEICEVQQSPQGYRYVAYTYRPTRKTLALMAEERAREACMKIVGGY